MRVVITNAVTLNGGDAAILHGTLALLREAFGPDVDVTVLDADADAAAVLYPDIAFAQRYLPVPGIVRRILRRLGRRSGTLPDLARDAELLWLRHGPIRDPVAHANLARLRGADLIVSAGGTYLVPHYDITDKLAQFVLADRAGRPVVLCTQSLGPFAPHARRSLRRYLRRMAFAFVRDVPSYRELTAIGVDPQRTAIAADAAFLLADTGLDTGTDRNTGTGTGTGERPGVASGNMTPGATPCGAAPSSYVPRRVAISVRDWSFFGAADPEASRGAYLAAMRTLVAHLVEREGCEILFVSTCQGVVRYWKDDSSVAQAIVDGLDAGLRAHVTVDSGFHAPNDLIARYRGCAMVVATRMHAAILALCAGVPVLPIAYEFKTTALFDDLDLGVHAQDIATLDAGTLCEAAHVLLRDAVAARARIARRLPAVTAAARHPATVLRTMAYPVSQSR